MYLIENSRTSAAWYLSTLAVGIVLARASGYFWFETTLVWGQPVTVVVQRFFVGVAVVLWGILESRERAKGLFLSFLIVFALAWFIHFGLFRFHGDAFNYTAVLYVPIILMVSLKPPRFTEGLTSLNTFAWSVTGVILGTLVAFFAGIADPKPQSSNVVAFDEARYWLPLNDAVGIDGRWTGPFSHNGDTAMMGALLVVIAFVKWRKSSWVYLGTGILTLSLTFGRASIGAALVGLLVIAIFSNRGILASVPRWLRIVAVGLLLSLAAIFLYSRPAGLTGRDSFWAAFLDLWLTAPFVGVGSSGVAESGGITQQWGHAHSMYIDELARYGLLGLGSQLAAIAMGLVIVGMAAGRGFPGPLAISVTYLIVAITEPRNSWIHPTVISLLILLTVAVASSFLTREKGFSSSQAGGYG